MTLEKITPQEFLKLHLTYEKILLLFSCINNLFADTEETADILPNQLYITLEKFIRVYKKYIDIDKLNKSELDFKGINWFANEFIKEGINEELDSLISKKKILVEEFDSLISKTDNLVNIVYSDVSQGYYYTIPKTKKNILVEKCNLKLEDLTPSDIDDTMPLFGEEGLGLDSVDSIELVLTVEKEFGVKIADSKEYQKIFTNIQSLLDYINDSK
jgi:acyl carrier protein